MSFENRRWIFLNSGDIDKVNFNELPLVESSPNKPNSIRYCHDNSKFMLRYDIKDEDGIITGRPDCFNLALSIDGYTEWEHKEVLEYLSTQEWSNDHLYPTEEM
jgi:hypothetical protein